MSEREFFRFTNPLDITIGWGRIIWAEATEHKGLVHPAGWVLPGGERTLDRERAEAVARAIDGKSK
jgi:hypothetical protein